jgi:hypothetical protein
MPLFAGIGLALGATAASAATVGTIATLGTVGLIGSQVYSGITQAAQAKKLAAQSSAGTTVDAGGTSNTTNLGRAALIQTSSQGVQGTDATGRMRLLGN